MKEPASKQERLINFIHLASSQISLVEFTGWLEKKSKKLLNNHSS